jgi:uncharacterized lipoprotein YmbA
VPRAAALLIAFSATAGCVMRNSQVAQLYVLDAIAAAEPSAAAAPGATLGVSRVTVPDWLERPEITARAANGEIAPDELARWGEPIGRAIQRVVAGNLALLLPDRLVSRAPFAAREAPGHRLELEVAEAARQGDGTVLVEARWAVFARDGAVLVQRRSSHRAGPARDPATTVRGMNEALAALSREIAAAVRALPATTDAGPD